MTTAEKLSTDILNNAVTVGMLKAYQRKNGGSMEAAADGIRYAIEDLITGRTAADSWLHFVEKIHKPGQSEEMFDQIYEAGTKGWEQGYIAGFVDRGKL